jgi:hypothetical protein
MKSFGAIIFAAYLFLGSLFPGNSFANFSELPNLIEHYLHHRDVETPGIKVLDFLALHYDNTDHSNSDSEHHNKLPLHNHARTIPLDKIVSQCRTGNWFNLNVEVSYDFIIQNAPLHSSSVFHGIFRPPQA